MLLMNAQGKCPIDSNGDKKKHHRAVGYPYKINYLVAEDDFVC